MVTDRRPRIIVGEARAQCLREFGFQSGLIEALTYPHNDAIAARLWASDGTVLAEIANEPYLAEILPPGRIVPVCHVDEAYCEYVLLVEEASGWQLLWFHDEDGQEAFEGGVDEFLSGRLEFLWETNPALSASELRAWAARVGHPAAARALRDA